MKSYNVKEVNKIIRKCLREAFPGHKFSVTKDRCTVYIKYTDGPNTDQVESVVGRFQGSGFDGMTDCSYSFYHEENGSPVNINTDYVFIDRAISSEKFNARKQAVIKSGNYEHLYDIDCEVRTQFNKVSYCHTQESKKALSFVCTGSELEKREEAQAKRQEEEAKKREEEAAKAKQARSAIFGNRKIKNPPVSVLVHWSESGQFEDNQTLSFAEFERICSNIVLINGDQRGYDKTKITVNLESGDTYQCRLDLSKSCDNGFIDHINQMIEYSKTEKGEKHYKQYAPDLLMFLNDFYVENNIVNLH